MNDQQLHNYCQEWVSWCFTRRYYLKPGAQNILARMQPSRSGREPDGKNKADMQYFNMAVHALADMPEYAEGLVCFNLFYVEQVANATRQAEKLGIARSTYYRRVTAFARKAYSLSISIKKVREQQQEQAGEPVAELCED